MSNKENISRKGNVSYKTTDPLVKPPIKGIQPVAHKELQQKLVKMHQTRDNAQNKYENVIASLEGLMHELLKRNDCLVRNRQTLLREQIDLKKKNGSLNAMIEAKLRLSDRLMNEDIDIFDIIVESASFSREQSRQQQSDDLPRVVEATSQIFQRHELAISSIPLSYNMSINEEEISMSNIGPTINHSFRNTNPQKTQSIYVQCSNLKAQGIIRAFYLSAIQRRQTTIRLSAVIESLKNDIISVIYEPYPNNQFWTEMLCNFLKILHQGQFDTQVEILEYLKAHRLIDSLIIKCLRTRIEFLFDEASLQTRKVLTALANEFGMKMQIVAKRYLFYLREEKEYNLLYSQQEQSEGSFQSEREEPCFVIVQRDDSLHITFLIEASPDREGKQSTHIKQVLQFQQNLHSLGHSEQNTVFNGGDSERTGSLIEEKGFNSTDGGRRLKKTAPFHDNKYSKKSSECLQSSRFFLNRVCSKKSDMTDPQQL